jgi:hypothetical protein
VVVLQRDVLVFRHIRMLIFPVSLVNISRVFSCITDHITHIHRLSIYEDAFREEVARIAILRRMLYSYFEHLEHAGVHATVRSQHDRHAEARVQSVSSGHEGLQC